MTNICTCKVVVFSLGFFSLIVIKVFCFYTQSLFLLFCFIKFGGNTYNFWIFVSYHLLWLNCKLIVLTKFASFILNIFSLFAVWPVGVKKNDKKCRDLDINRDRSIYTYRVCTQSWNIFFRLETFSTLVPLFFFFILIRRQKDIWLCCVYCF